VAFPQSEAAYLQLALKLDPASNERRSVSNEQEATSPQQGITNDDDLKVPSLEEEDVKLGVGKR
jgi:hypothetical protein